MNDKLKTHYKKLCDQAGFTYNKAGDVVVGDIVTKIAHPYQIYLKVYRDSADPENRLNAMKQVHHLLWPFQKASWNHWQERMYRAHCERWEQVVLAGGAATTKSATAAQIVLINYLSNPRKNAAIVASVTLESLQSRIFGYVVSYVTESAIQLPLKIVQGSTPKIIHKDCKDKIHGIFAVAAKQGADEKTISGIIGRHPKCVLMVVLDEATDMPASITQSFPNLMQGVDWCQIIGIGNSKDKGDLHGAMATPAEGWDSIDPMLNFTWRTKAPRGICVYLNPYDSPAVIETDPIKKKILSKIFLTEEKIAQREKEMGKDSSSFMRFVMGFWAANSSSDLFLSEVNILEVGANKEAHWSGLYPLQVVAGLDPALGANTKGCVLQMAVYGVDVTGKLVLDFRKTELTKYLDILPQHEDSPEKQLADQVASNMNAVPVPLNHLAIDATGLGRAIGELIKIKMMSHEQPIRVLSSGFTKNKLSIGIDPRLHTDSAYNMWATLREFIQHGHIKGLSEKVIFQLTNRRIKFGKGNKPALEEKGEYINRVSMIYPSWAHSPHETDAVILCLYAAIISLGFQVGQTMNIGDRRELSMNQKMAIAQRGFFREEASLPQQEIPVADFSSTLEDSVWTPEDAS